MGAHETSGDGHDALTNQGSHAAEEVAWHHIKTASDQHEILVSLKEPLVSLRGDQICQILNIFCDF